MPAKKNQHYVPQSYLRQFSVDHEQKHVGVYVLHSKRFLPSAPIRTQAYEKYFYGEDLAIENALEMIEGRTAAILRDLVATESVPADQSEDFITLVTNAVFQRARTRYSADAMDESIDKLMKAAYGDLPELKESRDKVRIGLKNPAAAALAGAARGLPLAFDLNCRLVINRSGTELITSDNPAVFYNQFLEERKKYGSNTGIASKGLQILLPVSPRHLLVFFDGAVYGVGVRGRQTVVMTKEDDVFQLNTLQYLNALECLYFGSTIEESDIKKVVRNGEHWRRVEKAQVEEFYGPPSDTKRRSLLMLHQHDIRCRLKLSWARILKKAKRYEMGGRAVHVRNEAMLEAFREQSGMRHPPRSLDEPTSFTREKPKGWDKSP